MLTDQETSKLKGFLGLCHRAGQVILGQDACVEAVRSKTAAVVLLDDSSTEVSKKRFRNSCTSHHVPLYGVPGGLIAQATGKDGRMVAAIRRGTMASRLEELMADQTAADDGQPTSWKNESADIAGVQAVK